ncbi:MAG: hypothetical protein ACOC9Q_02360 [bacterium]
MTFRVRVHMEEEALRSGRAVARGGFLDSGDINRPLEAQADYAIERDRRGWQ